MHRPCKALILEDDPAQLAALTAVLEELFLDPLPARTPDEALSAVRQHPEPILAVIDLDMSLAPEATNTVDDVLRWLYEHPGGCCVLINSVRADDILERKRIERIHPLAMFVAKQDGLAELVGRVRRLVGVRYGDLAVRRGLVVHEPSGQTFTHRVAVSLLLGTATGQEVMLDHLEKRAVRRLRWWLEDVSSPVRVVYHGHRCYGLHVSHAATAGRVPGGRTGRPQREQWASKPVGLLLP